MNEKPSAWTPEEKSALFAAVEQYRATGGQLDWDAIAATVPGRSSHAVEVQYYKLQRVRTLVHIPAPAASPPPSIFRRPCLRCRRPFDSLDRKRNWICSSCNGQIAGLGSIAA
jgi:hypothetical protein